MLDQLVEALVALEVPGGRTGAITVSQRLSRSQVRSLIVIIEQGTFAQAAAKLALTPASLQRAARKHIDPATLLDRNDAYSYFERLGDLVITGPTFTNVNDFRAVLVL